MEASFVPRETVSLDHSRRWIYSLAPKNFFREARIARLSRSTWNKQQTKSHSTLHCVEVPRRHGSTWNVRFPLPLNHRSTWNGQHHFLRSIRSMWNTRTRPDSLFSRCATDFCNSRPLPTVFRRYADAGALFVPTRMNLRSDCGTAAGSCHSQTVDFRASSRSLPPIHSTSRFADNCSDAAHLRNGP